MTSQKLTNRQAAHQARKYSAEKNRPAVATVDGKPVVPHEYATTNQADIQRQFDNNLDGLEHYTDRVSE